MAQYFMGDTRLADLERMMMDPSRTPSTRAGTGKKKPQAKLPRGWSAKPYPRERKIQESGI